MVFGVNGAEGMRIDSSRNLLVGTTGNNVSDKAISVSADTQLSWYYDAGNSYANIFNPPSSASLILANGYQRGTSGTNFKSSVNAAWAKSAVEVAYGAIKFYVDPVSTVALGTVITPTLRATIDSSGHFIPGANASYDLGSSSLRWRNVYTSDLHLSNGIGNYTIVEGEEDLFLYNNKNGKTYKFALIEVDKSEAPPKMKED
jgi:hypothetical protein